MFESTPTSELIKSPEYTMSARQAEYLRANLRDTLVRIQHLESPDGPKTPGGRIPAATKRDIAAFKQYVDDVSLELKTAPPRPVTFCHALNCFTHPLVHMINAFKKEQTKFLESFKKNPTYTLEWHTSSVIAAQETANYARGLLSYAGRMIKEHGHTVGTLTLIRDGIAEQRDRALKTAIDNITYSTSSSPTHNVANIFKQHGRIEFVNKTAWPLLSTSQNTIDAYKAHLELKGEDK